jgi:carbon-monoxide dehydrogenase medium subunit
MQASLPAFDIVRPTSLAEASELLAARADDAVAMCGGTELLLLLKLGLSRPASIVDVKRVPQLVRLEREGDVLVAGAATTHRQLEHAPLVRELFPELAAMERMVANVRVRATGTIGGNVAFADPHSDVLTFLAVTDTDLVLEGTRGPRVVPLAEFVRGPYETELAPGELITTFRIPLPKPGTQFVHRKLAFHERPAVTVTCSVRAEGGTVQEARLAIGSVGARIVRVEAAAELAGMRVREPEEDRLRALATSAAVVSGASADANGSQEYKLSLVTTLARRAVDDALRLAAERS